MPQRTTIIWDWNGTLLDDAEMCLEAINIMLKKRNLPELSMERYRDVFTFPVIEYYREVGFDFTLEAWDPVATEFRRGLQQRRGGPRGVGRVDGRCRRSPHSTSTQTEFHARSQQSRMGRI